IVTKKTFCAFSRNLETSGFATMKKTIEKYINYVLIGGFLVFGVGIVTSIINQTKAGMPLDFVLILVGLALLVLGLLAAKIFGDVIRWKT
ncbi:MAG: hypothetical protein NWE99_01095, partial [Candidatus Bathyarchaeota archaeon]|nr:hypothetical protein [Candidatus Bathyarchaeota archaeon]